MIDEVQLVLASAAEAELSRRRVVPFAQRMDPRWEDARHLRLIADGLEELEARRIRRLAICLPPRHGKTALVSQKFVAWYLGRNPSHHVILASYGTELAEANSRAVRSMVQDERYPFDVRLREDSRSAGRWETNRGGVLVAVGVGSGLTGRGGDLIVMDDLIKDRAEADSEAIRASTNAWFSDVLRTRAHPNAAMVAIGTRWTESDVLGRILEEGGWRQLTLPLVAEEGDPLGRAPGELLWPDRFGPDDVPSVERGEISSRSFSALYQQHPTPASGNVFDRSWLEHRYADLPHYRVDEGHPIIGREPWQIVQMEFDRAAGRPLERRPPLIIQACDSASSIDPKRDRSAIATLLSDGSDIYLVNLWFGRLAYVDLRRVLVEQFQLYRPGVLYIEAAQTGFALIDEIRRSSRIPIAAVTPQSSKEARVEGTLGLWESGRIKLPRIAPWLEEFTSETLRFPHGRHDDLIDAVTLGIEKMAETLARLHHRERFNQQLQTMGSWFAR